MGTDQDSARTRHAMIEAAGKLFAKHGYDSVTVRQIVAEAKVSLSALNYHFGDKRTLYREVLSSACDSGQDWDSLGPAAATMPARQALRVVATLSLNDYVGEGFDWRIKLFERELLDPSEAFHEVIRHRLLPDFRNICAILAAVTGRQAEDPAVQFGVITLYTLASTFGVKRRALERISPGVMKAAVAGDAFVEVLSELAIDAVNRFEEFSGNATAPRKRSGAGGRR